MMAEQIDFNHVNLILSARWPVIKVRADAFDHKLTDARHEWLNDSTRAGRWYSHMRLDRVFEIDYTIEDPDVAIEFKMRFG